MNISIDEASIKSKLKAMHLDGKNSLIIQFKPGTAGRRHAEKFIEGGTWVKPDRHDTNVPGRDIFYQYFEVANRRDRVIDILKKSMTLRFKCYNVERQLKSAGEKIIEDIVEFIKADNLKPSNAAYWRNYKNGLPTGIYTGEMINSLEAVYVREP